MTLATWRAANELDLAALLCISGSGFTVRSMARFRPNVPISNVSNVDFGTQEIRNLIKKSRIFIVFEDKLILIT